MADRVATPRRGRRAHVAGALLCALVAMALSACGSSDDQHDSAAAGTRTVVDMAGRSVEIPARVTRVATNYPALNEMLFMLGHADDIAATSDDIATDSVLFPAIYPRLKQIPAPFAAATGNVNAESLLATRPDVVLLSPNSKGLLPTMKRLGIPALVFAYFKGPDELKAGVDLVAKVVGGGAAARARQFSAFYDANVAQTQRATAQIPKADQPTVYYTAGNPLQTEGKGSIVSTWLKEAGARNVAEEHGIDTAPAFATVTLENVLRWNPDVIVCRDAATKRKILADPRWRAVKAVRDKRVYANPLGVFVWSVRSGESALQPLWAAKTLHPKQFAGVDLRKEVKDFYSRFYSYALSDKQVDSILHPS